MKIIFTSGHDGGGARGGADREAVVAGRGGGAWGGGRGGGGRGGGGRGRGEAALGECGE
jgi:hypothetical protein